MSYGAVLGQTAVGTGGTSGISFELLDSTNFTHEAKADAKYIVWRPDLQFNFEEVPLILITAEVTTPNTKGKLFVSTYGTTTGNTVDCAYLGNFDYQSTKKLSLLLCFDSYAERQFEKVSQYYAAYLPLQFSTLTTSIVPFTCDNVNKKVKTIIDDKNYLFFRYTHDGSGGTITTTATGTIKIYLGKFA